MDTLAKSGQKPERTMQLEQAGYNVVNLHPSKVEYDLMTDSWTELVSQEMTDRMADLRARADFSDAINHATELFPFDHFITVSQGRAAEAWFWRVAAKKGKAVVQNILFPTTRHHLALNRMTPVEIPVTHVFSESSSDLFRGNLDCGKLRDLLSQENCGDVAYIYIEAENNASGGYPVSMANAREVHTLARDYGVQMVLDATRLAENSVLIQRHEPGYADKSVREIYTEFCGYFDHMTCSLAKDFGITRGGLIATRDERLLCRAKDMVATYGPGVNVTDKALINVALQDWVFIEDAATRRVDQTARLNRALSDAGVKIATPASGHCILMDVADFIDCKKYRNPVVAFTAWIYEHSGVRGGMHVSGMARELALPTAVRFAVPLCARDALIDELVDPFVSALTRCSDIPDMEKTTNMPGIDGHMHARYQPVYPAS